jgi:ankyrin repeat protein
LTDRGGNSAESTAGEFSQFSLRTLFFVVTCFAFLGGALVCYQQVAAPDKLIAASGRGEIESVKRLIDSGASVHIRDGWSTTPLMMAAGHGHVEVIRILIEAGAAVDERSRLDRTPLMWAARSGQLKAIEFLLGQGADESLVDQNGKTAQHLACVDGHSAAAAMLSKSDNAK